jgi:hypothetical protein
LYELLPGEISKLILLAPDGLKVNGWYKLATQTWIGNRFFKFTMKQPGWFFGMLRVFNRLGFVNKSIFKFVNYYIGDKDVRESLYTRWTALRKFKPRLSRIKKSIAAHKTETRLFYGKHDRIIVSAAGNKFSEGIDPYCRIDVIEAGHQVLHENYVREILGALKV